jgi:hypothetical protein
LFKLKIIENNELTQNQILVEVKRISKNIQFFFWLTIASIGFSLILWVHFSTSSSNDYTIERDKEIEMEDTFLNIKQSCLTLKARKDD